MLSGSGCVERGEHTPSETWFGITAIIALITLKQKSFEEISIIQKRVVVVYQLQLLLSCKLLALNALWMKDVTPLSCISHEF